MAASGGQEVLAVTLIAGAISGGTSLLWAGLGETISERAGVINVGTEGTMLSGALTAFAVTVNTGNVWLGTLAGAGAGAAMAAIHAWMVVHRRASQLATGLVVMFLALGLTSMFGVGYVSSNIQGFRAVGLPVLDRIPILGPSVFTQDPLVYLSYAAVPLCALLLFRTRWGLLVRAAGERPESLRAHGISPALVRDASVILGGALAGIGGAQLSTALALSWAEGMTAGRGFIAVALVIFGGWNPFRVMLGAYLFGAAITLGGVLQVEGVRANQFLLDSIPYVLTLAVLVVLARRRAQLAPEALGSNLT